MLLQPKDEVCSANNRRRAVTTLKALTGKVERVHCAGACRVNRHASSWSAVTQKMIKKDYNILPWTFEIEHEVDSITENGCPSALLDHQRRLPAAC